MKNDVGDDDSSDDEEPKKKKDKTDPKEPTDEEPKKKDKKKDPETPRPKLAMTNANATPKSGVKAKWSHEPCIGFENTRKQVMCKSGKGGPGSTLAMKFADYGGKL